MYGEYAGMRVGMSVWGRVGMSVWERVRGGWVSVCGGSGVW